MPRIIIDCNLLIKKISKKTGVINKIVEQCLKNKFQPLVSHSVLKECLGYIGQSDLEPEYQDVLEDYFSISEIIKADFDLVEINRSAESNKYIQCALAGQADYLITANKDLLKLQKFFRTEIVTPQDFLSMTK